MGAKFFDVTLTNPITIRPTEGGLVGGLGLEGQKFRPSDKNGDMKSHDHEV